MSVAGLGVYGMPEAMFGGEGLLRERPWFDIK